MPNPSRKTHAIVWSKSDIPSQLEYEVLCHLASDKKARVYLHPHYNYSASVSNAGGVPGWTRSGTLHQILWGGLGGREPYANGPERPWVVLDKVASRRCQHGIKAYKITDAGFEAIAQHDARWLLEDRQLVLARRLINLTRKHARALKPK